MTMLSEDDLNLRNMSREELVAAWDLWFDLAQTTNDADPPYTHGVFADREMAPDDPAPPVAPARVSLAGQDERRPEKPSSSPI